MQKRLYEQSLFNALLPYANSEGIVLPIHTLDKQTRSRYTRLPWVRKTQVKKEIKNVAKRIWMW